MPHLWLGPLRAASSCIPTPEAWAVADVEVKVRAYLREPVTADGEGLQDPSVDSRILKCTSRLQVQTDTQPQQDSTDLQAFGADV